jgi:MoaA/NifB/PqqE/SkfB family radical SAM enzyme
MSDGVYSADKAAAFPDRLASLREGKQPAPVHLHLILSDLCNLDCPGCAYRMSGYSSNQHFNVIQPDGSSNHNPNRMLATPLVLQTLAEFRSMGGKSVEFTGGGEPTLHPDFAMIVDFAQKLGLKTAVITNGILLRKRLPPALLAKLDWLRISIDAGTAITFGKVRPGLGGPRGEQIDVVWDALAWARSVVRDNADSKCIVGAGFVVQESNWPEIVLFTRRALVYGAHNVRISGLFTPEKDAYYEGWRERAEEQEREAVRLYDSPDFRVHGRLAEKIADLQARPDYSFCGYENFTTYMGGDGNLYRCCVTSYNDLGLIGNVEAAGGFRALWESERKRDLFGTFDARSCTQCQFNDRNRAIERLVKLGTPSGRVPQLHDEFI